MIETVRKSGNILISMLFIERNLRIPKVINSTHFKEFTKSCTMCLVTDLSSKSEILIFCMSLPSKVQADMYYKRKWGPDF